MSEPSQTCGTPQVPADSRGRGQGLRRSGRAPQPSGVTATTRIQAALELLAEDPRPPAATPLVGGAGEWSVRTGDYRIVYEIEDDELLVLVLQAAHRREI
jgi:mRNA interferase RelE/StbE